MALQQQMEQQRLRWKSEIVSSNSMLNTVGGLWVSRPASIVRGRYCWSPCLAFPPQLARQPRVVGSAVSDLPRVAIAGCYWERCSAEATALTVGVELGSRAWQ